MVHTTIHAELDNRTPAGLESEVTVTKLHAAYVVREGEGFIFLSPDGKEYLEVNLPRLPDDLDDTGAERLRDQVINLLDGKTADGEHRITVGTDGTQYGFKPLRYARRWFTTIILHEEKTSDVQLLEWSGEEWITDRSVKFQGRQERAPSR